MAGRAEGPASDDTTVGTVVDTALGTVVGTTLWGVFGDGSGADSLPAAAGRGVTV
jgi:hypothetical protein